jgi:hypothetical protein
VRAVGPLKVWMHPLGICKVSNTHADQLAKQRATTYRIHVLPLLNSRGWKQPIFYIYMLYILCSVTERIM